MTKFGNAAERLARQFLLLALFFVPFSTALMNVFVAFTYIAFLFALVANRELRQGTKRVPSMLALGLFILLLIGSAWSIAPEKEILQAIGKYAKLLLIPIGLALAWRDATLPRRALVWFLAGAAVLALSSYLVWLNLMPSSSREWWRIGDATNAVAFKNHITMGVILGFSTLVCLNYCFYAASVRAKLSAIGAAIFFAFPIIFLTQGRTGYVVLFVGLLALCALRFRANWKMLVASMLAAVVLFAGFYSVSDNFKTRTDHLVAEIKNYSSSQELNSSGIRLSFYRAGLQLLAEHPVLGNGTGSFPEGFAPTAAKLWPPGHPFHLARHQPHSELVLFGVQLGAVGLIVYLSLLVSLAGAVRKNRSCETDNLLLMCVIFGTAAIFNSLLWDTTEGHWFTLLAGCLYAQVRKPGIDTA
jgi:O-antigen ligase